MPEQPATSHAIPFWGAALSGRVHHVEDIQSRDHDLLIAHGASIVGVEQDIDRLEASQDRLAAAVNRLTMALVLFSLTLAGSAVGALIALGGTP